MIKTSISCRLVCLYAGCFALGVISGGISYLNRSSTRVHQSAGTSAWTVHLVLTSVAVLGYLVIRRLRPGTLLLLAPAGRCAERRIRGAGPARLALIALPALFVLYGWWRAGEQVLAGLDPHFTANAWGGPSYFGAMYCHYLDAALIALVAAALINRILPRSS